MDGSQGTLPQRETPVLSVEGVLGSEGFQKSQFCSLNSPGFQLQILFQTSLWHCML